MPDATPPDAPAPDATAPDATPPDEPHPDLVARCRALGMSDEEIAAAGADLGGVAASWAYARGEEPLTAPEVAARAGLPVETVVDIVRATGLTDADLDAPVFGPPDVELLGAIAAADELIGRDQVHNLLRVAGTAIGRIGDAATSTFILHRGVDAAESDPTGVASLEANLEAAEMLPVLGRWLERMLVRHIRTTYRMMSDEEIATVASTRVDVQDQAIGFADLVGSTAHAQAADLADLERGLDAFESQAAEIVRGHGGRVVKFIGDEVMYRADDATTALAIGLRLIEHHRSDDGVPPIRIGVAEGTVLARDGDFYGPVVNLAARVAMVAGPDEVVAPAATDTTGFTVHPLGPVALRGMADPVDLVRIVGPA